MRAMIAMTAAALTACSPQPDTTNATAGNGHDMAMASMTPAEGDSAATTAFKQSMATMMHDAPAYTGDADVDFMQQMRVHHVAAVAMAQAQLRYGKDADARRLAQAVIDAQQREIGEIDRWLAARR